MHQDRGECVDRNSAKQIKKFHCVHTLKIITQSQYLNRQARAQEVVDDQRFWKEDFLFFSLLCKAVCMIFIISLLINSVMHVFLPFVFLCCCWKHMRSFGGPAGVTFLSYSFIFLHWGNTTRAKQQQSQLPFHFSEPPLLFFLMLSINLCMYGIITLTLSFSPWLSLDRMSLTSFYITLLHSLISCPFSVFIFITLDFYLFSPLPLSSSLETLRSWSTIYNHVL